MAALMVLAMAVPTFAEDKVAGLDTSVSVTGMKQGDQIKLYQVLTWDDSAAAFKLAPGFENLKFADGQTPADVVAALSDSITQAEANAIAAYTKTATKKNDSVEVGSDGSFTYTLPVTDGKPQHSALGLYVGVITAGTPKYVYNPVFVSADFITNNDSGTIAVSNTYSDSAVAKVQEITVSKTTSDTDEKVREAINSYVGEVVDFEVKTTIPVFMDSYKNPSFVVKDAIQSSGIELVPNSITVKLGSADASSTYDAANYTVAENGKTGYTVTFKEDYLKANNVAVDVVIQYKGKITNEAKYNVNEDTNEVTVTYSNGPDEEKAALRDRTNHYTFSLGADVFGDSVEGGKTFELVKVGVDANGKPVVEKKFVSEWEKKEERHPLAGATFGLYTDEACTTLYTNDLYKDGATFVTGNDGVLTYKGLAAGTYYLKEISAPSGYIASTSVAKIEIEAEYDTVTVGDTEENGIKVAGYTVAVLKSYTVKVNNVSIYDGTTDTYGAFDGTRTNVYTYQNDGKKITTITGPDKELDSDLINTVGVELPHTGGMGTTILYVAGSILVLAAAILLVTKRRMNAED